MDMTQFDPVSGQSEPALAPPRLPRPLALALRLAPKAPPRRALVFFLNRLLEQALRSGDLDWLQGKVVSFSFEDADVGVSLTLGAGHRLKLCSEQTPPDLLVQGLLYDFLGLAARREDSDTLFFHRRLHLDGDVELGLYLKNFLDGLEPDPAQRRVLAALQQVHCLVERLNNRR